MEIMGVNNTEHTDFQQPYKRFVEQLSGWYGGGALPELASQDLRFSLELQRQKINSLGLDMQCSLKKTGADKTNIAGITYSDRVFTNSIVSGNVHMTRSIGSKQHQMYKYTNEIGLTAVIQNLKGDTQPNPSMPLCCPHCGAASTLGELEDGCEYCGTKFVMSELYPKVSNFFITGHEDRAEKSKKNKRQLATFMAAFIVPMVLIPCIVFHDQIIARIAVGIITGGIIGLIMFGFKKLFETFSLIGKNARGGSKTISTLYRLSKIKKHDPEFSGEYFRDKVIALFRMAVYSKDATELACCKCQCPEKAVDIIEADIFNLNVNSCEINGDVCDVETTLFLDCLHYRKGKIVSKCDKFHMSMRKRLKKPTELGFSMRAVSCHSCGASFDAHNVKDCPYCHTPYELEEDDWVVTDIY